MVKYVKYCCLLCLLQLLFISSTAAQVPLVIDKNFNSNGKVRIDFDNVNNYPSCLALMDDGRIILVGNSVRDNKSALSLVRFQTDGTLDTTFAGKGKMLHQMNNSNDQAIDCFVQKDGKILVAGQSRNPKNSDFLLLRFLGTGELDKTFASDGVFTLDPGGYDYAQKVLLDNKGNILLIGATNVGGDYDFAVARLHPNGYLDSSFGNNGITVLDFNLDNEIVSDAVIQSEGRIIIGGTAVTEAGRRIIVAGLTPDGKPDQNFGNKGLFSWDFKDAEDYLQAITLQDDDKIILGGYIDNEKFADMALLRLSKDGLPDDSFADNGYKLIDFKKSRNYLKDILIDEKNRIVAIGYTVDKGAVYITMARLMQSGEMDFSFSNTGVIYRLFDVTDEEMKIFNINRSGHILIAGHAFAEENYDFSLYRFVGGSGEQSELTLTLFDWIWVGLSIIFTIAYIIFIRPQYQGLIDN